MKKKKFFQLTVKLKSIYRTVSIRTYSINIRAHTRHLIREWLNAYCVAMVSFVQMWIRHKTVVVCEIYCIIALSHWVSIFLRYSCQFQYRVYVVVVDFFLNENWRASVELKAYSDEETTSEYTTNYCRWVKQLQMKPHAFIYVVNVQISLTLCVSLCNSIFSAHKYKYTTGTHMLQLCAGCAQQNGFLCQKHIYWNWKPRPKRNFSFI